MSYTANRLAMIKISGEPLKPLCFWRLNDNGFGGVSLADYSGNNYILTNNNLVELGSGIIQGCANFSNANQSLSRNISFDFGSAYSISMWVNISSLKTYFSLISGNNIGTINISGDASGLLYFNNAAAGDKTVSNFFTQNNWIHCVFRRSPSSVLSVYKNGVQVLSSTTSSSYGITTSINIGNVLFAGGFNMIGRIDAVGLWNREITESEISQLYNGGAGIEI